LSCYQAEGKHDQDTICIPVESSRKAVPEHFSGVALLQISAHPWQGRSIVDLDDDSAGSAAGAADITGLDYHEAPASDVVPEETMLMGGSTRGSASDTNAAAAAIDAETVNGAEALLGLVWHRWSPPPKLRQEGFFEFFLSAHLFYWCVFATAIVIAICLRTAWAYGLDSSSSKTVKTNSLKLLVWVFLALLYLAVISNTLGPNVGKDWLAGYVLELVFMVENIFIFSMVLNAFKLPESLAPRALLCVVVGQMLFELIFFMGLAAWLRSFVFLPYILGMWLIGCGLSAFFGGHEHPPDASGEEIESPAIRRIRSLSSLIVDEGSQAGLLISAVFALLLACFFLEIDIVLMKIEQFHNGYISFSSSALAALALPELFAVGEWCLNRFSLLKYGIASILVIFGVEMLAACLVKYELSPVMACSLVGCVLVSSIIASVLQEMVQLSGKKPVIEVRP